MTVEVKARCDECGRLANFALPAPPAEEPGDAYPFPAPHHGCGGTAGRLVWVAVMMPGTAPNDVRHKVEAGVIIGDIQITADDDWPDTIPG